MSRCSLFSDPKKSCSRTNPEIGVESYDGGTESPPAYATISLNINELNVNTNEHREQFYLNVII